MFIRELKRRRGAFKREIRGIVIFGHEKTAPIVGRLRFLSPPHNGDRFFCHHRWKTLFDSVGTKLHAHRIFPHKRFYK